MSHSTLNNHIAFQGELGSYSHIACQNNYPDMHVVPCPTFDDVFHKVKNEEVHLAMVPIENTIAGRVTDVHRLIRMENIYIRKEYFMPIHHSLLAIKGTIIEDITHVLSHEMALGQCQNMIRDLGLQPVIMGDTAGAARIISESQDTTKAAIAPDFAAQIHHLDILEKNIEDRSDNTTRFLVFSRTPDDIDSDIERVITSLIFTIRHVPAALYKILGSYATNNVNMTKLESYQIAGDFSSTQFYVDIEGHPDKENIRLALEEMTFFCSDLKILGVYAADAYRYITKSQ